MSRRHTRRRAPRRRAAFLRGARSHRAQGAQAAFASIAMSRFAHATLDAIQFGGRPVVARHAWRGHRRRARGGDGDAYPRRRARRRSTSCPKGAADSYVGGGASVRVAQIIGSGRMVEMMLTGQRSMPNRRAPRPRPLRRRRRQDDREGASNSRKSSPATRRSPTTSSSRRFRGSKTCRHRTVCGRRASSRRSASSPTMREKAWPPFSIAARSTSRVRSTARSKSSLLFAGSAAR